MFKMHFYGCLMKTFQYYFKVYLNMLNWEDILEYQSGDERAPRVVR